MRARPLLVDNNSHLWFLNADGSLAALSEDRGRSTTRASGTLADARGYRRLAPTVHMPHPPGQRQAPAILVSMLTEADVRYLEWLETQIWDFVDGGHCWVAPIPTPESAPVSTAMVCTRVRVRVATRAMRSNSSSSSRPGTWWPLSA